MGKTYPVTAEEALREWRQYQLQESLTRLAQLHRVLGKAGLRATDAEVAYWHAVRGQVAYYTSKLLED